ncbi:hypothetical protein PSECIP111854_04161 [Pseudoalteromonas sp. CIP111854]|uniref:RHS repeat-associated core domain-containing protein n=2 Tax=Pseudoalteromonas holothuriae TaxID=2963714 RepID=A0A9W4VW23_9GAMM|nr:hypothetical protein PSECIP111854_04161 [Pseudoalteromonas sp. CIP111854]
MNGRVYDYNLGRFMSVDPVIQAPGNSQSINPYSYIMNNPLSGTDPSGYEAEKAATKTTVVSTTGSNIKRRVKSTVTSDGNGGATVTITGGNGAARSSVKAAITGNLQGAGMKVMDIGGQGGIAKQSEVAKRGGGDGAGGRSHNLLEGSDGSLTGDIKAQSHNTLVQAGEELGVDMGGVDARWGSINIDENGGGTAKVICDLSCQKDAGGLLHGRDMAKADLSVTRVRMAYRQSQRTVTTGFAYASVAMGGGYIVVRVGGGAYLAWGGATTIQRNVSSQLISEVIGVFNGTVPSTMTPAFNLSPAAGYILPASRIMRYKNIKGIQGGKPRIKYDPKKSKYKVEIRGAD